LNCGECDPQTKFTDPIVCNACAADSYFEDDTNQKCLKCTDTYDHCSKCDSTKCSDCEDGYLLNDQGKCVACS